MPEPAPPEHIAINCNQPLIFGDVKRSVPLWKSPELIGHFITHSLSDNSKRAYTADIAHFGASGCSIPCPSEIVATYLATLADSHATATIQRRLAAISKAHRVSGHADPCKTEIVRAVMQGIRRTKGVAQREVRALQRDDLFIVLERMGGRPIDIRDKALLLIGFAGAFRRSELVGLNCEDVEHARQGIVLHLRRSKTDQLGRGRKIAIPHGRTRWCPVDHLTEWLTHAKIERGPLFRGMDRHGNIASPRLSGDAVATIIKKRVQAAGFDPASFSGHSLRAGFATSAVTAGASTFKIRAQTGHKSDTMLGRYVRSGDMFTDNAAGAVL